MDYQLRLFDDKSPEETTEVVDALYEDLTEESLSPFTQGDSKEAITYAHKGLELAVQALYTTEDIAPLSWEILAELTYEQQVSLYIGLGRLDIERGTAGNIAPHPFKKRVSKIVELGREGREDIIDAIGRANNPNYTPNLIDLEETMQSLFERNSGVNGILVKSESSARLTSDDTKKIVNRYSTSELIENFVSGLTSKREMYDKVQALFPA